MFNMNLSSILISVFFGVLHCQQGEKISFQSPELSDEEQFSTHMPSNLKCDACTAVAYQMTEALQKAEQKSGGKKLKESDYLDVFDTVCGGKSWENYGLKSVEGVNRISGKGLPADDVPGMMYGGGKWPGRLMTKCFENVGEYGEDELYDEYRRNRSLKHYLCIQQSNDCGTINKKEL